MIYHAVYQYYAVLVRISPGYSPLTGRLHTCYSPVRRSPPSYCYSCAAPRLACVRPVASVHPEPGSNSSLYLVFFARMFSYLSFSLKELTSGIKNYISLSYTTLFLLFICFIQRSLFIPSSILVYLFQSCSVYTFSVVDFQAAD